MTDPMRHPLEMSAHLLSIGRPEEALAELSAIPGDGALSLPSCWIRAAALHELDRDTEAVEAAEIGLARYGPDVELLSVLGAVRQALGQLDRAEGAFLDALAEEPTSVIVLCQYAQLCLRVQQLDKAERLIERAAHYEPEAGVVARARTTLAIARNDGRHAAALSRDLLGHNPEDPAARALYGAASAIRGDVASSYDSARWLAASEPGDTDVVETARDTRAAAHPALLPLRPVMRFGPMRTWLVAVSVIFGARLIGLTLLSVVAAVVWVGFAVYSWVAPPVVRRIVRRRWR